MSNEPGGGFSPTEKPGKWTLAEFKQAAALVKDLLADQPLIKFSIYAAGLAGALDCIHWIWLFILFLQKASK
jgi:hypothetical protein